jgi:hypothetical protein
LSNQWTKKVLFNFVYLLNLLSWFTDTNKGGIMAKYTVHPDFINVKPSEEYTLIIKEEEE